MRIEIEIIALFAGSAAEREYLVSRKLVSIDSVFDLAVGGVSDRSIVSEIAIRVQSDDPEVADAWLNYLQFRAKSLVRRDWKGIECVAAELLKRTTLSAREVHAADLEASRPSPGSIFYKADLD